MQPLVKWGCPGTGIFLIVVVPAVIRGVIALPYWVITDAESYQMVRSETLGTESVWITPSETVKHFPIIPGILHYQQKHVMNALILTERASTSPIHPSRVVIESLAIEHQDKENEWLIGGLSKVAVREFYLQDGFANIGTFRHRRDDMVLKITGLYIRNPDESEPFSMIILYHFFKGTRIQKEMWYRGE